jgi:hypothetical protein
MLTVALGLTTWRTNPCTRAPRQRHWRRRIPRRAHLWCSHLRAHRMGVCKQSLLRILARGCRYYRGWSGCARKRPGGCGLGRRGEPLRGSVCLTMMSRTAVPEPSTDEHPRRRRRLTSMSVAMLRRFRSRLGGISIANGVCLLPPRVVAQRRKCAALPDPVGS